jgi:hypothetical protein
VSILRVSRIVCDEDEEAVDEEADDEDCEFEEVDEVEDEVLTVDELLDEDEELA